MGPDQLLRPVVCYFNIAARSQSARLQVLHRRVLCGVKCNEAFVAAVFPDPIAPRSVVARRCDPVRARGLVANTGANPQHYPRPARMGGEPFLALSPPARHVAALADSDTTPPRQLQALEEDARSRNIELSIHRVKTREEIVPAIEAARAAGAEAINVLSSVIFYTNRALIIERAAKAQLPAVFQFPEWADQGALVGYGPPVGRYFPQLARQLVKVLNGTAPTDIPV